MKRALLLITAIFMMSACSLTNSPETGQENTIEGNRVAYGLLGPGPINYGVIRDDVDEYRYDGMINQTPSFRTLDRHRQDFGDDKDKVRTILLQEGVQPDSVFIIGKDIWVNATLQNVGQKEREQLQSDLQELLTQAMQRYDIHLRINP
ncbi:hypothetical protein H1D32_21750 [Anaerobacillus sp. CMMVII]|uniref:hypothetical protein n=1 Tax=Anaerobacillus sp. CMMVII TaxID=2755588 RepID=UPI0021B7EE83|nr:hypothetical protein [Anaerobacillus sp. CMMVII]MCT8140084.1 hypothetical protein [Anaerobacillus sp. CMMVII]